MKKMNGHSKFKDVRRLLSVVGAALLCAILLTTGMLHYYGPNGRYSSQNVLLSPENAFSLSFADPGTKSAGRYIFDRLDFSYYDVKTKQKKVVDVNEEKYGRFYALVKNEESLAVVDDAVLNLFSHGASTSLTLMIEAPTGGKTVFSEVDFTDQGDYYRVLLRQDGRSGDGWAYYHSPGIYQKVMDLFTL